MGMFCPCLVAAILNGCAIQIFREPIKVGNGPLMALYMFIFTTFILLWSVRLYPRNLRRIGKLHFIIEFFVAQFLMEDLIIDFWFPLEKFVQDSLQALGQNFEDWMASGDWSAADPITDFLKSESTGFYISYVLALFFLIATLHASRIIDLRTLTQDGPTCFFKEIWHKMKIGSRRLLRGLKFGKRKVRINEQLNTIHPLTTNYSDFCKTGKTKVKPNKPKPPKAKSRNGRNLKKTCPKHSRRCGSRSDSDYGYYEDLGTSSGSECPM